MYNNVSKIITCESIEKLDLGDILLELLESDDSAIRFILGSRHTIKDYMSMTAQIRSTPSNHNEKPSYIWHIDATCTEHPQYQAGMALFRGYVDVELFFANLLEKGLGYLCFMNTDTCVIVYVPSRYKSENEQLENKVDSLACKLAKIPNWIIRFFNRKEAL